MGKVMDNVKAASMDRMLRVENTQEARIKVERERKTQLVSSWQTKKNGNVT